MRATSARTGISIHAPAQGATGVAGRLIGSVRFQFTLPHRERHISVRLVYMIRYFNSRSRTGSDWQYSYFIHAGRDFNSRSRTGSDRSLCRSRPVSSQISIHAPAQGATDYSVMQVQPKHISIHAPAQGATFVLNAVYYIQKNFNSRSRTGSDKKGRRVALLRSNFNSRSRTGSDNGTN